MSETEAIPTGNHPVTFPKGGAMSANVSSLVADIDAATREYVVARTERQMRTVHSAAVATLMGDGHSFEAIRDALVAKCFGDPNWKAGLR
jgi:hypothetical protein